MNLKTEICTNLAKILIYQGKNAEAVKEYQLYLETIKPEQPSDVCEYARVASLLSELCISSLLKADNSESHLIPFSNALIANNYSFLGNRSSENKFIAKTMEDLRSKKSNNESINELEGLIKDPPGLRSPKRKSLVGQAK